MAERPSIKPLLGKNRIIPVLTFDSAEQGVAVVRALAAGGVTVAEVTLRTEAGLAAIAAIRAACPDVLVGAGTILTMKQMKAAVKAGAQFIVTPGTTPIMLEAMATSLTMRKIPCLLGASTVSEMLALWEHGYRELKFFPAVASGGMEYLRAVAGPCQDLCFCPTGGINASNAREWLALPNVLCVGGTWLTPKAAIEAQDYAAITRLAAEAVRGL